MTYSDALSIIALIISIVSASGVYIAPLIHGYFNKKATQRDLHKQEIREHVFYPLILGINYYIQHEVMAYLTGGIARIPSKTEIDRYAKGPFDFKISPQTITINEANNQNYWFDEDLYSDLKCHNSELHSQIEEAESYINRNMPSHVKGRWNLTAEIYNKLKPVVEEYDHREFESSGVLSLGEVDDLTSLTSMVALLKILNANPSSTGLENLSSRLSGKKELQDEVERIASEIELSKMAEELKEKENGLVQKLTELRSKINREATSGSNLKGKCHYLGYEKVEC